jgi:hypothetical protein
MSDTSSTFEYLNRTATRPDKRKDNTFKYLPSEWDSFFKGLVTAGWCVKSDGDVDSTTGYFALTEVGKTDATDPEFRSVLESMHWYGDLPDVGWYVSVEDSAGFIFVYQYANQYGAETAYAELETRYDNWCGPATQGGE